MPKTNHQCILCGRTSEERVLLQAEEKGRTVWVCVRCLPTLIHGKERKDGSE